MKRIKSRRFGLPALTFTVPFAVGTMLNTLWGMVIVLLIGAGPAAGGG